MHRDARDAARRALDERGFVVIERLIPADALAGLALALRRHEEEAIPMSAEILFTHCAPEPEAGSVAGAPRGMRRLMNQWLNPHRRPAPFTTRAVAASLRPIVAALLGEPVMLFQDMLMDKGFSHRPFPWHQDFPFWPVAAPIGLVLWAPLDPVDEPSGGLSLAEESHRGGIGPAVDLHTGEAQPGSTGTLLDLSPYKVVCPRLAPGDAIVFHPLLWHASPPNRSGNRRRVWASTWLGTSACWSHARAPRHPLCRILEDGAPVLSLDGGLE